jgi:hypothetical protein
MGFQLKSGNKLSSFKMMGSSPLTTTGHNAPENHSHPNPKTKDDPKSWYASSVDPKTRRITNTQGVEGDDAIDPVVDDAPGDSSPDTKDVTPGDTKVTPGGGGYGRACGNKNDGSTGVDPETGKEYICKQAPVVEETEGDEVIVEGNENSGDKTVVPGKDATPDTQESKIQDPTDESGGYGGDIGTSPKEGVIKRIGNWFGGLESKGNGGGNADADCAEKNKGKGKCAAGD